MLRSQPPSTYTAADHPSTLHSVPPHVLSHVLSYLGSSDLQALSRVSRYLRQLVLQHVGGLHLHLSTCTAVKGAVHGGPFLTALANKRLTLLPAAVHKQYVWPGCPGQCCHSSRHHAIKQDFISALPTWYHAHYDRCYHQQQPTAPASSAARCICELHASAAHEQEASSEELLASCFKAATVTGSVLECAHVLVLQVHATMGVCGHYYITCACCCVLWQQSGSRCQTSNKASCHSDHALDCA